MENVVATTQFADRPAPDWPAWDETTYQLRFERRANSYDADPTHSFAYPHLIRPIRNEGLLEPLRAWAVASWYENQGRSRPVTLLLLPLGGTQFAPHFNHTHMWLAVVTHTEDGSAWALADASHFFTHDGDLNKIPHKTFIEIGTLPTAVNSTTWLNSGTNMGYFMQMMPQLDSQPEYWEPYSGFGDFRKGFTFSRRDGVDPSAGKWLADNEFLMASVPQSSEFNHAEDRANWRIIATTHTEARIVSAPTPPTPDPERLRLERQINEAKAAIRLQTMDHDGCDAGKREFLESTGLFTEEEIDGCFEREYTVTFEATVQYTVRATASSADDARESAEQESYTVHDEAIISAVRSDSLDYTFVDVEEE